LRAVSLGESIGLGVEPPELIHVELVHPGNPPRIHRDVVKGRVGIGYRIIHGDVAGGVALQQGSRQATIGIGLRRGVRIMRRQVIHHDLGFLVGQVLGARLFMDAFPHPGDLLLPIVAGPSLLRRAVQEMALDALGFHDRLARPFRQVRRRQFVIELVAGYAAGAANPSIRYLCLYIRQRHIGCRRLVGGQRHRRELALEAVPDTLHRVIPRGQVVH
jgi:hypothetical protein